MQRSYLGNDPVYVALLRMFGNPLEIRSGLTEYIKSRGAARTFEPVSAPGEPAVSPSPIAGCGMFDEEGNSLPIITAFDPSEAAVELRTMLELRAAGE